MKRPIFHHFKNGIHLIRLLRIIKRRLIGAYFTTRFTAMHNHESFFAILYNLFGNKQSTAIRLTVTWKSIDVHAVQAHRTVIATACPKRRHLCVTNDTYKRFVDHREMTTFWHGTPPQVTSLWIASFVSIQARGLLSCTQIKDNLEESG